MRIDDELSRIIKEVADETGFEYGKVTKVVKHYWNSIYNAIKHLKAYKITMKFIGHFHTSQKYMDYKLKKYKEHADRKRSKADKGN